MKKLLLVVEAALLIWFAAIMIGRAQELVTLTTPVTSPNATNVRLKALTIDLPSQTISVDWYVRDSTGGVVFTEHAVYSTPAPAAHPAQPTGATLITTLNTANLTSNSLVKRVMTRLQADGYVAAGTISGTPE